VILVPLSIPAFAQYQAPLFPLRGLWNSSPKEGDKQINVEIDWGTFGATSCVQFALSGNSPVALSQIVALYVDNSRCGADVSFIFPDTSFQVTIPAHTQGLVPVLSNALMFYASSPGAAVGDTTIAQICNSMPPPIPLTPSSTQQHVSGTGISLSTVATTPLVPAGVNGTLTALSLNFNITTAGGVIVSIRDGAGNSIWSDSINVTTVPTTIPINLSGLNLRFVNGLNFVVTTTTFTAGPVVTVNAYYTTP
jgi:hypothetical protein